MAFCTVADAGVALACPLLSAGVCPYGRMVDYINVLMLRAFAQQRLQVETKICNMCRLMSVEMD